MGINLVYEIKTPFVFMFRKNLSGGDTSHMVYTLMMMPTAMLLALVQNDLMAPEMEVFHTTCVKQRMWPRS